VWDSARARYFKQKDYAPDDCTTCEDFAPCACACPLYWEHRGYEELHDAWARRAPIPSEPVFQTGGR
jgi:radical SAM protein with 4Fe4S-binding SPASM domain